MISLAVADASQAYLPRELSRVADRVGDAQRRERLRGLFEAAARIIGMLGELDLDTLESRAIGDPLQLWLHLAPAIKDTVESVTAFLELVRREFDVDDLECDQALSSLLGETELPEASARDPVADAVQPVCARITGTLERLRKSMQGPQRFEDGWSVLTFLGETRGRLREEVGELVYAAASSLEPVRRRQVVPGYDETVLGAVSLRQGVARLRRRVMSLIAGLESLPSRPDVETLQRYLRELRREVEAFATTSPYSCMRASDRKRFVASRERLVKLDGRANPGLDEIQEHLQDLVSFLSDLYGINRRKALIDHDRDVRDDVRERLLAVLDMALSDDLSECQRAMQRACAAVSDLMGRDRDLDDVIEVIRGLELAAIDLGQLHAIARLVLVRLDACEL